MNGQPTNAPLPTPTPAHPPTHTHTPPKPPKPQQGEQPEDRQQWRDEVLSTSAKDFKEFGERLQDLTKVRWLGWGWVG
jgi:hypothetical protein